MSAIKDIVHCPAATKLNKVPELGKASDSAHKFGILLNEDDYLVSFDNPKDPMHPLNWKLSRKIVICVLISLFTFCNSFGSSLLSESSEDIMKEFNMGFEVALLTTALYVFGFALGPIVWAPLSEIYGRRIIFISASFSYSCLSFIVATGKDIQAIMVCRFFCGFFGGSTMVLSSSTISDLYPPYQRGRAMIPFSLTVCSGPLFGPIVSSFTAKNHTLGWRYNAYWSGIIGSAIFVAMIFFLHESYHPVVLSKKAATIRKKTGNWAIHASHENLSLSFTDICVRYITRPLDMVFHEPILCLLAVYGGFVYGLIFSLLTAIPLVFRGNYGFTEGISELPYISVFIGCLAASIIMFMFDVRYRKIIDDLNVSKPLPEERLPPMIIGGFGLVIGLFLFSWTGDFHQEIPWIIPTIGISFVGFGLVAIFQPCINYVVDTYGQYTASALAVMTFVRSTLAGAFTLFSHSMFMNMGIRYAGTLLGCVAIVLLPVPFLFYKFGKQIRKKSKFSF